MNSTSTGQAALKGQICTPSALICGSTRLNVSSHGFFGALRCAIALPAPRGTLLDVRLVFPFSVLDKEDFFDLAIANSIPFNFMNATLLTFSVPARSTTLRNANTASQVSKFEPRDGEKTTRPDDCMFPQIEGWKAIRNPRFAIENLRPGDQPADSLCFNKILLNPKGLSSSRRLVCHWRYSFCACCTHANRT
jgi:hypothetical protein